MTDSARFRRVEQLFDRALEQPKTARAEWLRAECTDEAVRHEVEEMLAAHERADGILDQAVVRAVAFDVGAQLAAALADRYEIERELGHGGTAIVYLAHELKHGRRVVLKVLKPEVARLVGPERFLREVQIAARLAHPNILALIDSGNAEGLLYYVMPHVEGETLRARLRRDGPLHVAEVLTLLRDVADALALAHREGVVHRDLKPENVLCVQDHAFLMDFGIAKLVRESDDSHATGVGVLVGTPGYMAPEQAAGDPAIDHKVDVYAWGLLAYEALTGQIPGEHANRGMVRRAPVSAYRDDAPPALGELIDACLELDPHRRVPDAGDIVLEIDQLIASGAPVHTARAGARRRPWAWVAAAGVLLAAAALARFVTAGAPSGAFSEPIAVTTLRNETGDSALAAWGRLAGDWITQGLQETGLVAVVPWPSARRAFERMEASRAQGESVDALEFMRNETGAGTVLTGSYYLVGDELHFQVAVTDATSGMLLVAPPPIATSRTSPEDGVRDLRERVMAAIAIRIDERLATMPGLSERPPTYEAYRVFDHGMALYLEQDYGLAVEQFHRAYGLDTTFLVPLVYAVTGHFNRDEFERADSLVQRLRDQQDRLSEYHRLLVEYMGALLDDDGERSLRMIRQAAALAPGSRGAYNVALTALKLNRPREALTVLEQLDPEQGALRGWSSYWTQLTHAHHLLGDHARELAAARALRRRFPTRRVGLVLEVRALAAAGRTAEIDTALAAAAGLTPSTYWSQGAALVVVGEELLAHGRPDSAARFLDAAIAWLETQLRLEPDHEYHRYWLGSAYYDARRWEQAARTLASLAEDFPWRQSYRWLASAAAARTSIIGSAEEWLGEPPPYERGVYTMYRARIAAIRGDVDLAVSLVSEALERSVNAFAWVHASAVHDLDLLRHDRRFQQVMSPNP